jgi:hypothetical protein
MIGLHGAPSPGCYTPLLLLISPDFSPWALPVQANQSPNFFSFFPCNIPWYILVERRGHGAYRKAV